MEHISNNDNNITVLPTDDATPREKRSKRNDGIEDEASTESSNANKSLEQQRNNVRKIIISHIIGGGAPILALYSRGLI